MLVEFSVTNFRSFKEKQTLSLVTKKSKYMIETNFPRIPNLLKRISIMGPNASGKSNILKAIKFAQYLIINSHKKNINEQIQVEPYLLNNDYKNAPSEFEFIFLLDGILYQYGFAATHEEITEEWLFVTPKGGNNKQWISRAKTSEKEKWSISTHIKGRRKEWIEETRENTLLLSILGTQKNAETPRKIIEFFHNIGVFLSTKNIPSFLTQGASYKKPEIHAKVLEFIKKADLGIIDLKTEQVELNNEYIYSLEITDVVKKEIKKNGLDNNVLITTPIHSTEEGNKIAFEFEEHESEGTKLLYSLAYPIISTLDKGEILIIDEIDRSMHFKELDFIIDLFTNEETNPHGAQLIFTNHDVTVLKQLERDEIYFVEKVDGYSSELSSLSEYENRDDVPYLKRYLDGLYGALPHIGMGV